MKKSILLTCILIYFFTISLYAKCSNYNQTKKYYTFIHKAESAILKDDFVSASTNYIKAFNYIKYPFPNDLFAATICMLKSGEVNIEKIKTWNKIFAYQTGVNIQEKCASWDNQKRTSYHNLLSTEQWSFVIKDTLNKSDYAIFIRNKLREIGNNDQNIRHKMDEQYGVQKYWIPESKKQIMYVDSMNLMEVEKIISDEKFNVFEAGIDGWTAIYLVIIHNSQWHRSTLIAKKLKELVKQGRLSSVDFAYLFDRLCNHQEESNRSGIYCIDGYFYGESIYWIYGDKYHTYPNFSPKQLEEINKNREDIFLSSIQTRIKQLIYQVQKENLFFIISNSWPLISDTLLDDIKKGRVKVIE